MSAWHNGHSAATGDARRSTLGVAALGLCLAGLAACSTDAAPHRVTARWVVPPGAPFDTQAAAHNVQAVANRERELDFAEALHPGARTDWRLNQLRLGTFDAFVGVGEHLFGLDTPWQATEQAVGVAPLAPANGTAAPAWAGPAAATRCYACHHVGGEVGSGTFADLVFVSANKNDDAVAAERRLPRMLAGAGLLELAARADASRTPYGWSAGRPRTLRDMVKWSVQQQLHARATGDELTALVAYIASMPPPSQQVLAKPELVLRAARGAALFREIGCAACHQPSLPVRDTTLAIGSGHTLDLSAHINDGVIFPYSDLRAHRMGEALREANGNDAFITPPLWGVASRTAFLHDGRASTMDEAIAAHGGEAAGARTAYQQLGNRRADFDLFLATLSRPVAMSWLR